MFVVEGGVECTVVEQAVNLFLDLIGRIARQLLTNFCKANASLGSHTSEVQNSILQVAVAHTRVSCSGRARVHQLCRGIAVIASTDIGVHGLTVSTAHGVVQVHVDSLQEVESDFVWIVDQRQTECLDILSVVEGFETASDAHISSHDEFVRVCVVVVVSLLRALEPHFDIDFARAVFELVQDVIGLCRQNIHDLTNEGNFVDFVAINAQTRIIRIAARSLCEVELTDGEWQQRVIFRESTALSSALINNY